jgi:uncharacterized protein (DUF305 family)
MPHWTRRRVLRQFGDALAKDEWRSFLLVFRPSRDSVSVSPRKSQTAKFMLPLRWLLLSGILNGVVRHACLCVALLAGVSLVPALAAQHKDAAPVIVQPGAPGEPSKVLPASTHPTLPPISHADIEFMQGMIMHHQQAVVMTALIASHTSNPDVHRIGAKISRSQTDEILMMKRWLAARGQATSMEMPGMAGMDMDGKPMGLMPGMLSPAQMESLRNARGAEFDRLFLTGMIQHHGGALIMVHDLFSQPGAGQDAELFDFATDVDTGQRAEIRIMQHILEELH